MQQPHAPPLRRTATQHLALLGAALLTAAAGAANLGAQVDPESGVERWPSALPTALTAPASLELAVYLAAGDQCPPVWRSGLWQVDLVCLDGWPPIWRVRGPFRGGEIRSQFAPVDSGWHRLTVRSDGVHTAELYVDGRDARALTETFVTWPAAWSTAEDFLHQHLVEHGTVAHRLTGRLGVVRVGAGPVLSPSPATLAFDSAAAAAVVEGAAVVNREREEQQVFNARVLLVQLAVVCGFLVLVGAGGAYWWLVSHGRPGRVA